ncbi:MAG: V-type ATP synthase subunit C [Methanospirillum sp.]|uniref:V-type ATP synthase subunit C n=1 Tax=Methanospirillum sp. TaxID=45200 RepID=UPI00236C1FE4|nr:V-type ATP synthase subunit C [Methanospirillum sp.]MDD1729024.1 V-type ATP synthase subunit C [Methanospirillum sp.]
MNRIKSRRTKLHYFPVTPTAYIYICTRLTVRKSRLIPRDQYMRLLNMDLNQIIRFIGETEYQNEVNELAGSLTGISLIEGALTRNFAETYQSVISITPGALHELTERYVARWDIWNVMLVLRSRQFGIPVDQVRQVLIPAGWIKEARAEFLLSQRTLADIIDGLKGWELHGVLEQYVAGGYHKGLFAEVENALYMSFYKNLFRDAKSGIRGGNTILPYLRFEIDITNIRNLFRLRAGSRINDIRPYMIPGGNLHPEYFQQMYPVEDKQQFIAGMQQAKILPILMEALQEIRCDNQVCEADAADIIWKRWSERKTPLFSMMMAVTRLRLHRLDQISRRYPFSVLPILSYLEHKRYEMINLRAIARGKQFGLDPDSIKRYLIL